MRKRRRERERERERERAGARRTERDRTCLMMLDDNDTLPSIKHKYGTPEGSGATLRWTA